ncbi:hypothetical protein LAZ67_X000689 [Cordylochernes scorpioides]|uniref:Transposase n=1 Tax=Cordylochernes scorpioides TaxID=51811 RepID=A0ABY6LRU1_9ARAC|nr:hypothetical protein LAZ67_X000689 [Cordylochernes scorpioides]
MCGCAVLTPEDEAVAEALEAAADELEAEEARTTGKAMAAGPLLFVPLLVRRKSNGHTFLSAYVMVSESLNSTRGTGHDNHGIKTGVISLLQTVENDRKVIFDKHECHIHDDDNVLIETERRAISNRLKVMGMVQKQGNWVPYELKPGNIERRICTCELLLKRQKRKGFLHRILTGDEKWIHYDNPKRRKSSVKPGHASTSTAKPNIHGKKLMLCIWWDQLGVIYYELLQPNETITGERYQQQLMRLSRALKIKRPLYAKRHDKVIYQHDNARPHVAKVVKETLEALQWDVLPHPLYSPDIAPSDYHMFRSMTHGLAEQQFTSYEEGEKIGSMFGSPQKTRNLFDTESVCCLKDGKKS